MSLPASTGPTPQPSASSPSPSSTPFERSVVDGDVLRTNAWLRIDLVALAAEHGSANAAALADELARIHTARAAQECRLYLAREASGRLIGFVLTRWQPLALAGKSIPAVHVVLTVAAAGPAGVPVIAGLLDDCRDELALQHRLPSQPPILWAAARSPLDFLHLASHLDQTEPRYDGSYSLRGDRIVRAIREQLGVGLGDADDHPFVLRGDAGEPAPGVRSAPSGAARYSLFEQLGVDAGSADRLIVIASPPLTRARRVRPEHASAGNPAAPAAADTSHRRTAHPLSTAQESHR